MKSIAIWCKPKNTTQEVPKEIELHFNLWKIDGKSCFSPREHLRFLDIGIKIDNTENVDELRLYFPFQIKKENINDIVHKFINKPDLIGAIFNENFSVTSDSVKKNHEIRSDEGILQFNIYRLEDTDIGIENKYDGTILVIKCQPSNVCTYYRIRINGPYLNSLSYIRKPSNAFFQSAFSKIEVIDFRVNEVRDLNKSLLEEIKRSKSFTIKKSHFFFVCSAKEEIVGAHENYKSCRNLENYRWTDYIGNGGESSLSTVNLAYHWKITNKNDFNILINSKFEKNDWITIGVYFIIFFIIGCIINLSSNYILLILNIGH